MDWVQAEVNPHPVARFEELGTDDGELRYASWYPEDMTDAGGRSAASGRSTATSSVAGPTSRRPSSPTSRPTRPGRWRPGGRSVSTGAARHHSRLPPGAAAADVAGERRAMPRDLPRGAPPDDGSADPRLTQALAAGDPGPRRRRARRHPADRRGRRPPRGGPRLGGGHGPRAARGVDRRAGAARVLLPRDARALALRCPPGAPAGPGTRRRDGLRAAGGAGASTSPGPVPWTVRDADLEALAAGYVAAGDGARRAARRPAAAGRRAGSRTASWSRPAPASRSTPSTSSCPSGPARGRPRSGWCSPTGVAPVPVAERLLAAADRPLDLLLLDGGAARGCPAARAAALSFHRGGRKPQRSRGRPLRHPTSTEPSSARLTSQG